MLNAVLDRREDKEELVMSKPSVLELIEALGYNDIPPLHLSPGVQKDIDEKGDVFKELFEEELLQRYDEAWST